MAEVEERRVSESRYILKIRDFLTKEMKAMRERIQE